MNPSSFELSLKPSKIYSPGFWTNLVNNFSKIHDLNERLTLIRKLKLELEQEAAWLVASQPVSFPASMAFVNNTIKALVEEEQLIVEGMKSYQTQVRFMSSSEKAPLECGQNEGNTSGNHLSGRRLDKIPMALNQHQERWVTVNPNKRKRASDALTNRGPRLHPFSAERLLATHGPIYGKRVGEDQVSCLLCHPFKAGLFRPGPR